MNHIHLTKYSLILLVSLIVGTVILFLWTTSRQFGAPPYVEDGLEEYFPQEPDNFRNWKRPEGPLKVGLQAGHWKRTEMPEELAQIRDRGGGTASKSGVAEWQVNLDIAEETKKLLELKGITVDILPATVPVDYWADLFVSIHADGSLSPLVSGYKVAAYRRDISGKADMLSGILDEEYAKVTGFKKDPNITRNMTGYYAFNWRRYDHAIHPMTPGVILETGFLTNYNDAAILINSPSIPAQGLANGIIIFLNIPLITHP